MCNYVYCFVKLLFVEKKKKKKSFRFFQRAIILQGEIIQKIRVCYFSMRNPYMKFQDDISFQHIIVTKFHGPKF